MAFGNKAKVKIFNDTNINHLNDTVNEYINDKELLGIQSCSCINADNVTEYMITVVIEDE